MFLANSLKEKLKKNYLEGDSDDFGKPKYQYKERTKDPRLLLSFKGNIQGLPLPPFEEFTTQKLQALDKNEWKTRFSLQNLRKEWDTKVELDFDKKFKKFSDDTMLPQVTDSKSYIKNLIDPDILELKQKRWNISNNTTTKIRPELKQTLFEVNHGLKDFKVVPLKEKICEDGVDTRDHLIIDGKTWNQSTLLLNGEKKEIGKSIKEKASENSDNYWKENEYNRLNGEPFPIGEDRKKVEIIRYFKKYRTPYQKTSDLYNTMGKVKELTENERSEVEKKVKYKNPGSDKEKINAIVFREMYNCYKYKYNELIGNLDKEEIKKKQREENKFHWKDEDLVNKIIAVNSINNLSWFKPRYMKDENKLNSSIKETKKVYDNCLKNLSLSTPHGGFLKSLPDMVNMNSIRDNILLQERMKTIGLNNQNENEEIKKDENLVRTGASQNLSSSNNNLNNELISTLPSPSKLETLKKEFLRPLIIRGNDIHIQQEKIKEKLDEEYKKQQKRELLLKAKRFPKKNTGINASSRYPISKEEYESLMNNSNLKSSSNTESNEVNNLCGKSLAINGPLYNSFGVDISSDINNSHFLEAYQKITEKEVNKLNKFYRKNRDNLEYEFKHPGTYRDFEIEEKITNPEAPENVETKKVVKKFWSCCMNSEEHSKGCQKIIVKKFKWLYD